MTKKKTPESKQSKYYLIAFVYKPASYSTKVCTKYVEAVGVLNLAAVAKAIELEFKVADVRIFNRIEVSLEEFKENTEFVNILDEI